MATALPSASDFDHGGASLRVAVVHYHLRPGGVTRVLQHAVNALAPHGVKLAVLCGEEPPHDDLPAAMVRVVPELGYEGEEAGGRNGGQDLVAALRRHATEVLGGRPDLWHFHNPGLGKNLVLPRLIELLAAARERLLIQIHDFAEDGRAERYQYLRDGLAPGEGGDLGKCLYPLASHVHYAVLNGRDRRVLRQVGTDESQVHVLPNAVWLAGAEATIEPPACPAPRLFLYPTRAIRRKNLGEFLIWAALAGADDRFAVTMAPRNPAAQAVYSRWVVVAAELGLPVQFECAKESPLSFAGLLASATAAVSTSVAEGFGLAFLEPWLTGTPLVGRNLPEITRDFDAYQVDLSHLYNRLMAPLAWIGESRLRRRLGEALTRSRTRYGLPTTEEDVDLALASCTADGCVDVGRLDEPMQEDVLRRLASGRGAASEMLPATLPDPVALGAATERNRQAVTRGFALSAYGQRLHDLYQCVAASSATAAPQAGDARRVVDFFASPERFCLLRSH